MSEKNKVNQKTQTTSRTLTGKTEPMKKISTGISTLDEILHGGFPERRTILIKGAAGTGKTMLGLEFMYKSALQGEPVILISFEETAEAIRQSALAMGWDLAPLEEANKFFLWEAKIDRNIVISGSFNLDSLLAVIKGKAQQMGATRLMIDAIDVMMRMFADSTREQNELYRLHDWLVEQQFTTILTAKVSRRAELTRRYEFLDYMVDCIVLLDLRVYNQVTTRRLRVTKYRSSGFYSNEFPYLITAQGNVILPVSGMQMRHGELGGYISSGNTDLDEMLGGGFHRASAIVISGPSGAGKTTLAATFVKSACAAGDKVLFVSFEDSQEAIVAAMRSPGINLQPALEQGTLQFHTILPEALVSEEHLYRILRIIDQFQPAHIVVDAVSACQRMGSDEAAFDFLVRLIYTCKQKSITCLMTNQLTNHEPAATVAGMEISSIVDTLISLAFVDVGRQIQRDLVIIKSRSSHHSNRHHLYLITDNGIRMDSLEGETGGN